jgi:hypothetical protein
MPVGLAYSGDLSRDPSPDMSSEIVVTNSLPPPANFPGMHRNEAKILNIVLLGKCPNGSRAHRKKGISAKEIRHTGSIISKF